MSDDLEGADIWGDSNNDNNDKDDKKKKQEDKANDSSSGNNNNGESAPSATATAAAAEEEKDELDDETRSMSISELRQRIHLLDNDIRIMRSDVQRIAHESRGQKERIRENVEKVKLNKQLPYLVGNVVEILEPDAEDGKSLTDRTPYCFMYGLSQL